VKIFKRHSWQVDLKTAGQIQMHFQKEIKLCPILKSPRIVAGADVSYSLKENRCFAAVLVFDLEEMQLLETSTHVDQAPFPYVPGYLTFREGPILLAAFEKLTIIPEGAIFDGQGIAHQRRMGIAAHLGLFLNIPTIGCAKKRLIGEYTPPGDEFGAWSPLIYKQETVGAVVRTRKNTQPVFISPGHLIDLPAAIELVLKGCQRFRLPEPTRQAHIFVNKMRKEYQS